jgi:mRNA interferase MazF
MNENMTMQRPSITRGDIFLCDFSGSQFCEQGGLRPCIVLSNSVCNSVSPVITVAAITGQITKKRLPTHVELTPSKHGIKKESVIMLEQIRTIDIRRLKEKLTHIDDDTMDKVNQAMMIQLGLVEMPQRTVTTTFTPNINKREAMAV